MTTRRECLPCNGIEARTPESVANRPALPALRYRVGRHGTILETMQARLSEMFSRREAETRRADGKPGCRQSTPAATESAPPWLHTRELNDPSIALLDAWATVGDVLTFYQERIANEGYLRTARERRSLTELARHVGYELRPALSASVYLAFDVLAPPSLDLDAKIPPPHDVKIPKGTQAKSVPLPGELPVVFETTEELTARPEWNVLKPRMFKPTEINASRIHDIDRLRFVQSGFTPRPGDMLLIEVPSDKQGQFIGVPRRIVDVSLEPRLPDDPGSKPHIIVTLMDTAFSQRAYVLPLTQASRDLIDSLSPFLRAEEGAPVPPDGPLHILRSKAEEIIAIPQDNIASLDETTWKIIKSLDVHISAITLSELYDRWKISAEIYTVDCKRSLAQTFGYYIATRAETYRAAIQQAAESAASLANVIASRSTAAAPILPGALKRFTEDIAFIVASVGDVTHLLQPFTALSTLAQETYDDLHGWAAENIRPLLSRLSSQLDTTKTQLAETDRLLSQFLVDISAQLDIEDLLSFMAKWEAEVSRSVNPFISYVLWLLKKDREDAKAESVVAVRSLRRKRVEGDAPPGKKIYEELGAEVTRTRRELEDFKRSVESENSFDELVDLLNNDTAGRVLAEGRKVADNLNKAASQFKDRLKAPGLSVARSAVLLLERLSQLSREQVEWQSRYQSRLQKVVSTWHLNGSLSILKGILLDIEREVNESASDRNDAHVHHGMMLAQVKQLIQMFDKKITSQQPDVAPLKRADEWAAQVLRERESKAIANRPRTTQGLAGQVLARMRPEQGQRMMTFLREAKAPPFTGRIFAFRYRAGLFGRAVIPLAEAKANTSEVIYKVAPRASEGRDELYLDAEYSDVCAGGRCLVLSMPKEPTIDEIVPSAEMHIPHDVLDAAIVQRSSGGESGKSTRMRLRNPWRHDGTDSDNSVYRSTIVHAGSVEMSLAEERIDDLFPANFKEREDEDSPEQGRLELSTFVGEFRVGAKIIVSGELFLKAETTSEKRATGVTVTRERRVLAVVDSGTSDSDVSTRPYSTLIVDSPLDVRLKRDTVRIYGNVVEATHGETQREVLGNGEGQGEFQQFVLSREGLSHLPRETASGMGPELALRVNDVEWTRGERPDDLQASSDGVLPTRYLARVNDDGRTVLRTGDGKTLGGRLPTGVANVIVQYRVGGGQAGNVREGSVTQLPSPPLNVTKVRNLRPASGGVDREEVDQARAGVPIAATALDRLVSLADFESFARRFAGVAKAQATFLTHQGKATIVVTVAALDDAPLDRDSLLFRNLDGALRRHSDPDQGIILLHREQMLLLLRGKVRIDPRYVWDSVRSEILGRLVRRFSFENAKLAEDVLLSDVISEIQAVHGVRYVDIDAFDRMRQFYDNTVMIEKERLFAEIERPGASVRVQRARELDDERVPLVVDAGQGVQCLPAQLAYFTNLPGTIDLEKAP